MKVIILFMLFVSSYSFGGIVSFESLTHAELINIAKSHDKVLLTKEEVQEIADPKTLQRSL